MQQDTINALANLASFTANDQNAVANLTTSNSMLASKIKALTKHNNKQKEEMEPLKMNVSDILSLLQDTIIHHNNSRNRNNWQNHNDMYQNW
eukprot:11630785-Ditylum_brightwellii.AAC.1